MLNLQKVRKMTYNPSGKNLENQENWPFMEDGYPTIFGYGKCCLKTGIFIFRGVGHF